MTRSVACCFSGSTRLCKRHPELVRNFQVRDTDLDALERVVSVAAYGDVEAEGPPGAIADVSLRRLLRLSQLSNEYLLHVQDHLATRNTALKVS